MVETPAAELRRVGLREGDVIADKYRLERTIGAGGMGVVVLATNLRLHERVAIKLLRREVRASPRAVARFVREARATTRLRSEHVVRVFDADTTESAVPYIVMEYLSGKDLATLLDERGPLPVTTAVDYVLQACEAIAEAHALGIVHRDLKPANLFVTRRPDGTACIKLLDFGVSKVFSATEEEVGTTTSPSSEPKIEAAAPAGDEGGAAGELTTGTQAIGSPRYMSPEQMRSARDVDARTDLWALGTILYECVTGYTPFTGSTTEELRRSIEEDSPAPMRRYRRDVPQALEATVMRCLCKSPDDRFADVAALAEAVAAFGSAKAGAAARRVRRIATLVDAGARAEAAGSASWRSTDDGLVSEHATVGRAAHAGRERHPWRTRLPLGIAAAITVGALAYAARPSTAPTSPTSPPPVEPSRAIAPASDTPMPVATAPATAAATAPVASEASPAAGPTAAVPPSPAITRAARVGAIAPTTRSSPSVQASTSTSDARRPPLLDPAHAFDRPE